MRNVTYEWDDPFFPIVSSRGSNCILIIQKMLVHEDAKYPKLTEMNVNSNAYNEFNDGFDSTLRDACNRSETGVSIRAMQVSVSYDAMCSTTNSGNLRYYDMSNDKEVNQCRFTWNWEIGDRLNTYVSLVVMRI